MVTLHEADFQSEVLESGQTVLVDFFATWCGPCRMLAPVLEHVAEQNPELKLVSVNVDEDPALASAYEIHNLPTILIFKRGEVIARNVGSATKFEIEKWVASATSTIE